MGGANDEGKASYVGAHDGRRSHQAAEGEYSGNKEERMHFLLEGIALCCGAKRGGSGFGEIFVWREWLW